jgi:hypothetical protein
MIQAGDSPPVPILKAVPTPDTEWVGATTANWSSTGNWSSGVPSISMNAWVNNEPMINGTATANSVFVGVDGNDQENTDGSMTIATGALLTVEDTLYLGAEEGDLGTVIHSGGTVSAVREYVGYRGEAFYSQKSGTNVVSEALYVGEYGGSSIAPARYTMSASSPGNGVLKTPMLIVGGGETGFGKFQISAGGTQMVEAGTVVVGETGHGTFIQSGGLVDISGALVIGEHSTGNGSYTLNGGVLDTGSSTVGRLGAATFVQNGGIHATEGLNTGVTGSYELYGGVLEFIGTGKESSSGAINLHDSFARVKASGGISNLVGLSLQNHSNAEFEVVNDTLVILDNEDSLFAELVNPNALAPHIVGSDLVINQNGFRASTGSVPDFVRVAGTGHVTVATGKDGVHLIGGLELAGSAVVTVESGAIANVPNLLTIDNGISVVGGTPSINMEHNSQGMSLGTVQARVDGADPVGIEIQDGAKLIANGRFEVVHGTEIEFGLAKMVVRNGGELAIGAGNSSIVINAKFSLESGSRLTLDVSNVESDRFGVEGAAPSFDGTLALDVPSDAVLDKRQIQLLATWGGIGSSPIDQFGNVIAGLDGDLDGGIILTNTTNESGPFDIAMAVLYPDDFTTFGINLGSACPGNRCIVVRSTLPGDLNGDDEVSIGDFGILQSHFGEPGPWTYTDGDLNGDGNVDIGDFGVLQLYYGQSWNSGLGGGGVPEPTNLALIGLAIIAAGGSARIRKAAVTV